MKLHYSSKERDYFHPVLILVLLTFPVHNGLISLCKYFFLIRNTFFFLRRKKLNIFKSLSIGYILEPMQGGNSSIQTIHGSMSKAWEFLSLSKLEIVGSINWSIKYYLQKKRYKTMLYDLQNLYSNFVENFVVKFRCIMVFFSDKNNN